MCTVGYSTVCVEGALPFTQTDRATGKSESGRCRGRGRPRYRVVQSDRIGDITLRFGRERQRELWSRLAGNTGVNLLEALSGSSDRTSAEANDPAQPRRTPLLRIGRLDACGHRVHLLNASGVKQRLSSADTCFEG